MGTGSKEAIEAIVAIAKEMKLKQQITEVVYRTDHEDYQVTLDDTHHCEIRENVINDYMTTKHGDLKREILFKLNHPMAWEDWEKPGTPVAQEDNLPVIDPEL